MRILSGIQPTNLLHIGNYFGALKPAVKLQEEHDLSMLIVDLHAITVPQKPEQLMANITFAAAAYLAAGLDPKKTSIIQQSKVSAHTELAWLLQCVARMGELERMTQYKDKSAKKEQNVTVGLFTYPVLMAADILLYDTEVVPVGEDQKQHLELARDLAERFNRDFGQTFTVPKPMIGQLGARILGLDDPEKKMSKSASSQKNYISLMDDSETISKKIKGAVTDSGSTISYSKDRPGIMNLLNILALIENNSPEEVAQKYQNSNTKQLKDDVTEALCSFIKPIKSAISGYLEQPEMLKEVVNDGSAKANELAKNKIKLIKEKMGLSLL